MRRPLNANAPTTGTGRRVAPNLAPFGRTRRHAGSAVGFRPTGGLTERRCPQTSQRCHRAPHWLQMRYKWSGPYARSPARSGTAAGSRQRAQTGTPNAVSAGSPDATEPSSSSRPLGCVTARASSDRTRSGLRVEVSGLQGKRVDRRRSAPRCLLAMAAPRRRLAADSSRSGRERRRSGIEPA